jgi:hypothetical protein
VELRCRRYRSANDCFQSSSAISYTDVLNVVEKLPAAGSTNISNGMLMGLRQLGVPPGGNIQYNVAGGFDNSCVDATDQCSRGGSARRVMVLMTDGVANRNARNDNATTVNCYATDLYQPNLGDDSDGADSEDRAKDCVMFYAQEAARNNITIYTIGLGNGADTDLLEKVAAQTGGQYFSAASPAQLDGIFDVILKSISVRLIQ